MQPLLFTGLLVLAQAFFNTPVPSEKAVSLYVGTFSERGSEGIYLFQLNLEAGEVALIQRIGGMESPSFLALHPNGRHLYSANRNSIVEGEQWGSLTSFTIDEQDGQLTRQNDQPSYGAGACYVSTDQEGKMLFVANYAGGSMAAFPLLEDGTIGTVLEIEQYQEGSIHPTRQEAAHAHACVRSPDNRYLYVPDLGGDRIWVYRIKAGKRKIQPAKAGFHQVGPGSGPRHLKFHPNGQLTFLAEELSSSLSVYRYHKKDGQLEFLDRKSTLPPEFKELNTVADLQVHPNGRFLYVSNRGDDSLALFEINSSTGVLTPMGHISSGGKRPRNFTIDPSGEFLLVANRETDNIVVFRIDPATGLLQPTGMEIEVPAPVCLVWGSDIGNAGH